MTITKNSLIMMIFFLTIKHCLAKSANSQQPTANSQQPTANSQILIKTIFYFTLINLLMKESSLGISLRFVRIANYPLAALFLCLGRLCFAGGASRSLLSLCSFDVSLRKHFGRSLRELPPQLTHRLSFSTFSRKSASRSLRVQGRERS